ncbi:hypothetical protein I4U23_024666 [Adineta vaga]|nr:hypothetical protein I4U23_024666 [Adineta vaga]
MSGFLCRGVEGNNRGFIYRGHERFRMLRFRSHEPRFPVFKNRGVDANNRVLIRMRFTNLRTRSPQPDFMWIRCDGNGPLNTPKLL